jgi:hypothetical protein
MSEEAAGANLRIGKSEREVARSEMVRFSARILSRTCVNPPGEMAANPFSEGTFHPGASAGLVGKCLWKLTFHCSQGGLSQSGIVDAMRIGKQFHCAPSGLTAITRFDEGGV